MKQKTPQLQMSQGFTLVELLVYFGIFAILLSVITTFFIGMLEQKTQETARSMLQQESQYVLLKLRNTLYSIDTLTTPSAPTQTSSVLEFTSNGIAQTISISEGRLLLTRGSEESFITNPQVILESLVFENQSGTSVHTAIGVRMEMRTRMESDRPSFSREVNATLTLR